MRLLGHLAQRGARHGAVGGCCLVIRRLGRGGALVILWVAALRVVGYMYLVLSEY